MAPALVTHPYMLALDPHEAGISKPFPPLATMVTAAAARSAGHDVVLWDPQLLDVDPLTAFRARLDEVRPSRVAILADDHSVSVKQCLAPIRRLHQAMAVEASRRGLPVLVAGPDVGDRPGEYLAAGAGSALVGDAGDVLAPWLAGEADLAGVHGAQGAGGRRPLIEDLDSLPLADRDEVDLSAYRARWARHGAWELNVWTARGCPYRCNWCAKPTWGRSYHVRSAGAVAAEVTALHARYQPDRIWFTDDIFALRKDWLRAYRAALPRPVPYRCLSRADLLKDPAYVDDLAATGCQEVWIGAESGSDAVLTAMDKDGTVAEVERATRLLHDSGVRIGFFLQLGYPGESLDDVKATVEMIRRLRPDEIGVSVTYPLPNTVFRQRVESSLHGASWEDSNENRPVYQAPYADAFYSAAKEVLRSTYSSGRAPLALKAFLRSPDRRTARRVAGAAFHAVRLPVVTRRMERLAVPNPRAVVVDAPASG